MQRRLLPLGNRLAEMLFRQRFERRQRFVRLRAVSDQANSVAVAHLQQRQLIEAARIDALPLFSSTSSALNGASASTSRAAGRACSPCGFCTVQLHFCPAPAAKPRFWP